MKSSILLKNEPSKPAAPWPVLRNISAGCNMTRNGLMPKSSPFRKWARVRPWINDFWPIRSMNAVLHAAVGVGVVVAKMAGGNFGSGALAVRRGITPVKNLYIIDAR
jgi:hypothetical protein